MLTDIVVVISVLTSFALVLLILLHSGKGGGLSDLFGMSVGSAAAGSTVAERNLDRITILCAVIWIFCVVILDLRWS